jgi:cyclic beta-1,2-glucan synthetase
VEWILGLRVRGMQMSIDPCIPRNWREYSMEFRYHATTYKIRVENPSSVAKGVVLTELDGKLLQGSAGIPLEDDGKTHQVRVVLG